MSELPSRLPGRSRLARYLLLSGLGLSLGSSVTPVRGDGGSVCLRERVGPYDVTVFSAPTPLRAGLVDLSVFVQDTDTKELVSGISVSFTLRPRIGKEVVIHRAATFEAATNKLLRSALIDIPTPGKWDIDLEVGSQTGSEPARLHGVLDVDDALPLIGEDTLWLGWPFGLVLLFGIHQHLVRRRSLGSVSRLPTLREARNDPSRQQGGKHGPELRN